MDAIRTGLEKVALACRKGLLSLADAKGSTFNGFPSGACGVAADIVGRVVWEKLQYEGVYVCGMSHPDLKSEGSHAWFEIGDFIIDITHDQFEATGLSGWVFERNDGWHALFSSQERREGFCTPSQWPAYPSDGYRAVLEEAKKMGLPSKPE
jgi:hypothetical protein